MTQSQTQQSFSYTLDHTEGRGWLTMKKLWVPRDLCAAVNELRTLGWERLPGTEFHAISAAGDTVYRLRPSTARSPIA